MRKILLVEDNESIHMGLEYLFEQEGYEFIWAKSKKEAEKALLMQPDIVLLDVSLPDGNGFEICRRIKEEMNTPVIFLTARDEEKDVVSGFDLGADDYVVKPFRNMELLSRVKNVLRRTGKTESIELCGIEIDTFSGRVTSGGRELELTKLEYQILLTLFSSPKKLFTREELLSSIWDMAGNFVNDNTLTVYIKRLRVKIGDTDGRIIQTVRGLGYRVGEGL